MYLRCLNCDWEQDDFWKYRFTKKDFIRFITLKWSYRPFGYNPESILMEDIAIWLPPRKINIDLTLAKEKGFDTNQIHSWYFLKEAFKRYFRVRNNMKWKTFKAFKEDRDKGKAICPQCGKSDEWRTD